MSLKSICDTTAVALLDGERGSVSDRDNFCSHICLGWELKGKDCSAEGKQGERRDESHAVVFELTVLACPSELALSTRIRLEGNLLIKRFLALSELRGRTSQVSHRKAFSLRVVFSPKAKGTPCKAIL